MTEKGNAKEYIQEAGEKTNCNDSVFSFAHWCDVINNLQGMKTAPSFPFCFLTDEKKVSSLCTEQVINDYFVDLTKDQDWHFKLLFTVMSSVGTITGTQYNLLQHVS